jgi:hypothetical protein
LGWHWDIPLRGQALIQPGDRQPSDEKHVTMSKYHCYCLFVHHGEAQTLFKAGKLFQQYLVDMWAVTEQSRLRWFLMNQNNLHAELYHQMADTYAGLDNDLNPADMGKKVILPATFTGSTRDMMENLQNSLA